MIAFYLCITIPAEQSKNTPHETSPLRPLDFCLSQLRKYHPHEPVFIFECGSDSKPLKDLCNKYGCRHLHRDAPVFDFSGRWVQVVNVESCLQMISDLHHCFMEAGEGVEWVMKLEPDVLIRGPVLSLPINTINDKGSVGVAGCKFSFNYYTREMQEILAQRNISEKYYSFAGGSMVSRAFISKLNSPLQEREKEISQLYARLLSSGARVDDMFISFLACYYGFSIFDWDQVMEEKHHNKKEHTNRRLLAPIVHGYKELY